MRSASRKSELGGYKKGVRMLKKFLFIHAGTYIKLLFRTVAL